MTLRFAEAFERRIRVIRKCPYNSMHGGCHYPDCPPNCVGRRNEEAKSADGESGEQK